MGIDLKISYTTIKNFTNETNWDPLISIYRNRVFEQKVKLQTAGYVPHMIDSFPARRTRTVFGPNGVADL